MPGEIPGFVSAATTWTEALSWWTGRDEIALRTAELTWTGAELIERAGGAARHLSAITEGAGPIPALLTATPAAFAYLLGGPAAGHPLAPLGPRLTAAELAPSIEQLGAPVLLTELAFEPVASELASMLGIDIEVIEMPERLVGASLPRDLGPASVAFVLHTSGTTGIPKPVAFSQGRMLERVRVNCRLFRMGPGKVFSSASPLHHIAGFGSYAAALASGAAVVPMERFGPEAWSSLAEHRVTHVVTVPTILEILLDAGVLALPDLELLQYGASPMHPRTLARVMEAIPEVDLLHLYGQTEGSPITVLGPDDHRAIVASGRHELLESVGQAIDVVDLRIDDVDDAGVGEVVVRAEHFGNPGADGWLRTGDLGRLDDEGYVYLVGRKGDMIIRGGENVYPTEVEQALELHPKVKEAAVIGVEDPTLGERVVAYVVVTDVADPIGIDELRSFARERLAGFKVPAEMVLIDELPRNAGGKLLRRSLSS